MIRIIMITIIITIIIIVIIIAIIIIIVIIINPRCTEVLSWHTADDSYASWSGWDL